MNKKIAFLSTLLFVGMVVLGYGYSEKRSMSPISLTVSPQEEQNRELGSQGALKSIYDNTNLPAKERAKQMMSQMTLEEKVGQLMIVGFDGIVPNDHVKTMIQKNHIGGYILFDRNMADVGQTTELNNQLQALALQSSRGLPLFSCLDQEGGVVVRMEDSVTVAPSQQKLAGKNDKKQVAKFAQITAQELKAMGFNVNFAPVLDLSDKDSRSFGLHPGKTAEFALASVKAYENMNMICSLKHFPGIGRSAIDPHVDPNVISVSSEQLSQTDLVPFTQVLAQADLSKLMVMVSHLTYPAYDPQNAASVSPAVIQQLLRKQLHYDGVVVIDDMEMGALTKVYSFEEMGVKALAAGGDLLLVCHEQQHQQEVYDGILQAVRSGRLAPSRIDEAVERVLTMKINNAVAGRPVSPENAVKQVGTVEHRQAVQDFLKG